MQMKGKRVVDAKKKLTTTITAPDLGNAQPEDPTNCAIAQSLRRSKGVTEVSVGASMVYVVTAEEPDTVYRYGLSNNERALIRTFDKDHAFPCGYTVKLDPVPASRRIGARKGVNPGSNKRSGKGRNALHRAASTGTSRAVPTRHIAAPA